MSTILRFKKEYEQNMNGNDKIYKQIKEWAEMPAFLLCNEKACREWNK